PIFNAALGLAEATAEWQQIATDMGPALAVGAEGLSLLVARTPEEEARAIAVCVHEALEADKSVAIIAPDQTLARRICAELARFSVPLDDAAGTPLIRSPAGRLLRQAVSVLANRLAPAAIMALLRNRHVSLGLGRAEAAPASRWLDLGVIRGQRRRPGIAGFPVQVAGSSG